MSESPAQRAGAGLAAIVEAMASRRPVPAGGAAAASAVAQGIALLAKGARITRRADRDPRLAARLDELAEAAVASFLRDCDAFEAVLDARRAEDAAATAIAWRGAIEAPLELLRLTGEALAEVPGVRARAKRSVHADVDAAVTLVVAGAEVAAANARVNLSRVGDAERGRLSERIRDAVARLRSAAERARG